MTFPTLIRTGVEQALVGSEWAQWRTSREMRDITSLTCDEAKALAVTAAIPDFLEEVEDLLRRLQASAVS